MEMDILEQNLKNNCVAIYQYGSCNIMIINELKRINV